MYLADDLAHTLIVTVVITPALILLESACQLSADSPCNVAVWQLSKDLYPYHDIL